jgi:predicted RNA-binding Zn ribbon-like protein
MTDWTKHRFSGGALALDLANTVIWKDDPSRRYDRLPLCEDAPAFSLAAENFSGDVDLSVTLAPPMNKAEHAKLLALREAIDDWLRPFALGQQNNDDVAPLFKACWDATQSSHASQLVHACALSAMQFFQPQRKARVKVCPACRWLFLDRSKNQSRRWCDMKMCGNRAKVQQHYDLKKQKRKDMP